MKIEFGDKVSLRSRPGLWIVTESHPEDRDDLIGCMFKHTHIFTPVSDVKEVFRNVCNQETTS